MAFPLATALLAGGGVLSGVLGNAAQERQAKAQMMARAAEQEAAPWTGMAAQTPGNFQGGSAGNILSGALSGVGAAQALDKAEQQKDLNSAWIEMLKSKNAPTLMGSSGGGSGLASGLNFKQGFTLD